MSSNLVLDARNLDLRYGRVQVLFDVSIAVGRGEFVALLGTNGAGKSTFLKAVSNISPISAGEVWFEGENITGLPPDEITARGLAHVPGGRGALPDLTVEENLRLGGYLLRHQKARMTEGIEYAVDLFPWMKERRRQLAGTLSGGEQQMLAIGRGLASAPELLMLDEPSMGLAPAIVDAIFERIHQIHRNRLTILLVEQRVAEALETCDRGYVLETGRVAMEGTHKTLMSDERVRRAYLGI